MTGLPVGVDTMLIVGVEHGSGAAIEEREGAVEAAGLAALIGFAARTHAEADGVGAVRDGGVVLQFPVAGEVVCVAQSVAAGDERAGHVDLRQQVAGLAVQLRTNWKRVSLMTLGFRMALSVTITFWALPVVLYARLEYGAGSRCRRCRFSRELMRSSTRAISVLLVVNW